MMPFLPMLDHLIHNSGRHYLILISCASASVAETQASDTTVIHLPAAVRAATLIQDLDLTGGNSAAEYQFTYPVVFAGRSGAFFIVDSRDIMYQDVVVRRYDKTGKFERVFGRTGKGPGEYEFGPYDVKELEDGRVLMFDGRGVLVYSSTGRFLSRWSVSATGAPYPRILVDPAGIVYAYTGYPPVGRPGEYRARIPYLARFRFDGTPLDPVSPPEALFPDASRMEWVQIPFIPRYYSAWSPLGYFVTAFSATFSVELRIPRRGRVGLWAVGDPVLSLRRQVTSVPVQVNERNDWRQSITLYMRGMSSGWQWSGPEIPRVKPAISDVVIADDGKIWVRLSQPAHLNSSVESTQPRSRDEGSYFLRDARLRWAEPFVYEVLRPSGTYVGQVRLPQNHERFTIQGDTIWVVTVDADGLPRIKRFRIEWGQ